MANRRAAARSGTEASRAAPTIPGGARPQAGMPEGGTELPLLDTMGRAEQLAALMRADLRHISGK